MLTMLLDIAYAIPDIKNHYYLVNQDSDGSIATIAFFSYFLLYNTMIPISLIVSLEFVKLI
jgi:hypothetical protein